MSTTEDSAAALRVQIEALQRQIKLLTQGLRQADRIRQLWDQSVRELQSTKRALQESRAFLDRVLTAAPDPIVVTDHRGRVVLANTALQQLVGLSQEQLTGRRVLRLLARPDRHLALAGFRDTPSDGGGEFAVPGPLEARHVATKWTLLPGLHGETAQVIIAGQDITERKRAEENLRETNAELYTLQQVSSAVARTMELDELYRTIFDTMAAALPLAKEDERAIFAVEGERMKLVAHQGASKELVRANDGRAMGECPCGTAAREGEVIIIPSCTAQPAASRPAPRPHGHIIIPLKAHDRVLGVFCCCTAERSVDMRRTKTFKAIGEQVGIAIENAMLYEEKKALSLHDPLTGLANRRCMDITMPKALARAKRYDSPLSVIMLDIDHFKRYNDTYGHQAGDELLAATARILSAQIRDADLVVRYGGEEFMVMLPETGLAGAQGVAERMRKAVAGQTSITVSLGVASLPPGACTMEELVRMADEALYRAKQGGRNRVEVAETASRQP